MTARLPAAGRRIDRDTPISFRWNGRKLSGFKGDTLASALLANGEQLVGRSFKYHRPRGLIAAGAEEPNALVGLGRGRRYEPNARATTTELFEGLTAVSQNHWPSLAFDIGALNAKIAPLLPAGFYYKTFIHPRTAWKHLFEPVIRQAAGLGKAPSARSVDADRYEYYYAHVDVLVVGSGPAGLAAACAASAGGARVLLAEQSPVFGGRIAADAGPDDSIDGMDCAAWADRQIAVLAGRKTVDMRCRFMVAGLHDHGYVLAEERLADHSPGDGRPRHRLWRIRARRVVLASGALERPLSFAGNDVPGVMLASAMRDYLTEWGVAPARRPVIVTNNDDAYRTALAWRAAGLEVAAILDARPVVDGHLPMAARTAGLRVETAAAIASVEGGHRVRAVQATAIDGDGQKTRRIACDGVAMSGGRSPVVHLWSHCGGKLIWDATCAEFAPDPAKPPTGADGAGLVLPAGAAAGAHGLEDVIASAHAAGVRAAEEVGASAPSDDAAPLVRSVPEAAMAPVWMMPAKAGPAKRAKAFLDFQNDVKVSDVALAAREGFESVEHTKRYTTLGMATDQGKLSNINGLAILADSLQADIPQVGTTTFRPPYTPISMGGIAGEARGPLFKPTRRTPMDSWHDQHGAQWEPVADWRRPFCYRQTGESTDRAVTREIKAVRNAVGLLDASTLGKILVRGPDAGVLLDRVYTNMMSTLKPGRCRYGLMCTENGFLFDDGVVARIDETTFLCHTTTGGSDRVHGWLEEWLQTEWFDLRVHTVNLTEQLAQIAVVGPKGRILLERLGGLDVGREALPFMGWAEGTLAGIPARVFRISFSGELSYEVAVPASYGQAFWDACHAAGEDLGVTPYGTEALHVLRAEKGFIMIGDETDGTVIPQDLGLGWAISKKKSDYIGKRAHARPFMQAPDRKQLVGLLTDDPGTVLPSGAHAVEGPKRADGRANTIGHVTSSYASPTLGRSIAMALIKGGQARMGQTLRFPVPDRRGREQVITAKVVDPVFYDPDGSKQNV